jgi:hypothetical protein
MGSTLVYNFAHSSAPIRKVKKIQFGIFSADEIVSNEKRSRNASKDTEKSSYWDYVYILV